MIARTLLIYVSLVPVVCLAAEPKPVLITFAKSDSGKLPAGWQSAKTGTTEGSVWKVVADESAPSKTGFALAQTAEGAKSLFNLCVVENSKFLDGEVTARIKAIAGKIDQGGGVVWRYQDAKNYYVCRFNPLEDNLRVYHVKAGIRTQLATKEDVKIEVGAWFTVGIKQTGKSITCSLDGKQLLEVSDDTFTQPGKVGVWTKADAQSRFDQFQFTPAK